MTADGSGFPRASVIIPAHNEELVIGPCLAALLGAARPGEFEVVVACNGCEDATAGIARHWGPDVQVIELPKADKTAALQAGDESAHAFPRLYLDADIRLDSDSARRLADALSGSAPALAASARMVLDLGGRSWSVRSFYRIWQFVPWTSQAPLGDGCYGMSAEGRSRFVAWPSLVADDLYANRLFTREERRSVPDATFVVRPPRTARSLLNVRTRVYAGNLEYAEAVRSGALPTAEAQPVQAASYLPALRSPAVWPALAVYLGITATAKARARWRHTHATRQHWNRDETARTS